MKKKKCDNTFILSIIAGALTIVQFVLLFFYANDYWSWLRFVGYTLWIISAIFGWLPIYQFRKIGGVSKDKSYVKTTKLVDTGLYAIVRHPQYTALPIMNIAFIFISQHWLSLVLGIPSIILMYFDTLGADEHNIKKFGKPYREYMKRVPRMNFLLGVINWLIRKNK